MNRLPLLLLCAALTAAAAPPTDPAIAFNPAQIASLGITLTAPQPAARATAAPLSAKVIAAPDAEWVVTAPTSAVVIRVPVSEGDRVAAGALLAELRSPEAPKFGAELAQAESEATLARTERDRDRQLFQDGIIAARRAQASEQAAAQADSKLAALRMQMSLMGLSADDARHGRVLARAPAAATVLERLVTPGQRVNEADPLLRLIDAGKLQLELQVPVTEPAFAVGDALLLPDGRRARVRQAGWAASESAQSVRVRAELPAGTSNGLRPGQIISVRRDAPTTNGWTLPAAAISRLEQNAYVFVRSGDGFRAVPVTVLGSDAGRVTVSGALNGDDQIAATGTIAIRGAWIGHGGVE